MGESQSVLSDIEIKQQIEPFHMLYSNSIKLTQYCLDLQVKSVKPALKQLQQSIQSITQLHSDEG